MPESEQRDQWGETAGERHDRILARDLAYLAFDEGRVRDGLAPTTGAEQLAFNAGYAAAHAETAEQAWDEGYMAVPADPAEREFFVEDAPNPYRRETS